MIGSPTPYPEINRLLAELVSGARAVLGDRFTGMYLDGSLACGDFDDASDVDFVIVTEDDVESGTETFEALQTLHERLAVLDTVWGSKLEGSYISRAGLRRFDPDHVMYPNIEWGEGERLKMAAHDAAWDIHRHILREHGVRVAGPPPRELIDPVTPDQLRWAAATILAGGRRVSSLRRNKSRGASINPTRCFRCAAFSTRCKPVTWRPNPLRRAGARNGSARRGPP